MLTVKFSGSVADLADERRHAKLPRIPLSTRDHQPRRLAVSPLRRELWRCRRSPGPTRPHGVLRSDPAVVPHVRFSIRSPAQASTGPAGRHLAPGRGLRHHPGEREATSTEVQDLRRENSNLKQVVAETVLENRVLKKSLVVSGAGDDTCD